MFGWDEACVAVHWKKTGLSTDRTIVGLWFGLGLGLGFRVSIRVRVRVSAFGGFVSRVKKAI